MNHDTKKNLFGIIEGVPGPGDYEQNKITLTKPVAMKKSNRISLLGADRVHRFNESKSMKYMETHTSTNQYITT